MPLLERWKWALWARWPQLMPDEIRGRILALSPYVCQQLGQGSPMIVLRRDVYERGGHEAVPGAPCNIDGEYWIVREWMRENPGWRP